ncbi:hypothetical protein H6G98_39455 [Nostoc sp. FACHB-857]|nr:hypothetical protein [Nostoc sp. FACHB-857]
MEAAVVFDNLVKNCDRNDLPAECEQMRQVCDRIGRVYSRELEESVQKFLEMLGKLKRAYLTELEEKVLSL